MVYCRTAHGEQRSPPALLAIEDALVEQPACSNCRRRPRRSTSGWPATRLSYAAHAEVDRPLHGVRTQSWLCLCNTTRGEETPPLTPLKWDKPVRFFSGSELNPHLMRIFLCAISLFRWPRNQTPSRPVSLQPNRQTLKVRLVARNDLDSH